MKTSACIYIPGSEASAAFRAHGKRGEAIAALLDAAAAELRKDQPENSPEARAARVMTETAAENRSSAANERWLAERIGDADWSIDDALRFRDIQLEADKPLPTMETMVADAREMAKQHREERIANPMGDLLERLSRAAAAR